MSFTFDASRPEVTTSTGHVVFLETIYNGTEKSGISIVIVAASVSLLAVIGLLVVLGVSAYKTMRTPNVHRFMRTHIVAYFISLLLCDVISAVGSLMNGHWLSQGGVYLGAFCTSQGALKNTGNVGTALWSMVIAIHTFCLLVLKWRSRDYVLYVTLFVVWAFIGLVVIIGPAGVQNMANRGPYFGVAGYWCWITDGYAIQRVTLQYLWMFLSAFISFVLYSMVFLCLRGNLIISGGKMRLRLKRSTALWQAQTGRDSADGQAANLAKHMLVYPIAYTTLILPIAICRFLELTGHEISFAVTIFADTIFLLSGLVNVVLFTTTRKIIPARDARSLFSRSKSPESDIESQRSVTALVTPFVVAEKVSVSPIKTEPQAEILPVPVPAPAMFQPHVKQAIPKRSVSLAPTVASVYSQKSARGSIVPPLPVPARVARSKSKSTRVSIRQSVITPLNVVKKSSLRRPSSPVLTLTTPEETEDIGHRESWSDESSLRYSGSSYSSTAPMRPSRPLPVPPTNHLQHSKSASSSSMSSYRAPGNRF